MKILAVAHAYPPESSGGTERYVQTCVEGLSARGHDLQVFAGSLAWEPEFRVERGEVGGIAVTRVHRSDLYFDHWDKGGNPHVAEVFEAQLRSFRPDVVHLHHWIRLSNDLVRRAAAAGVPSVIHLHDLFTTCPRVFRRKEGDQSCADPMGPETCLHCVPRWSFQRDGEIQSSLRHYEAELCAELRHAVVRLAPSPAHARTLERYHGAEVAGAVEVLPHPLMESVREMARRAAAPAGSPPGRLRVLFFSMLHPIKGAHVLLEAVRSLGPGSGIEVEVFGGFATPEYERTLRELSSGQDVTFHGAYDGGEPAAVAADVVVIPAQAQESYSFWLDEAYATGLPIVASRIGALTERASGRVLLVEPGDARALAAALAELRDDPARRDHLRSGPAAPVLGREEHLRALEVYLERARGTKVSAATPAPPAPSTLIHDWNRREAGFAELLRSEGWEVELQRLQAEIRALKADKGEI